MIRQLWARFIDPIDASLMTITGLLALLALGMMASASPERMNTQLLNISVALAAMWVLANIPPQRLMQLALPIYLLGVFLLIATALFGDIAKGARRWLDLGFIRVQPSELLKLGTPMLLAWYFDKR